MPKVKSKTKKALSDADKARFLRARKGYGDIVAQQILEWTSRARRCTASVASGDLHPDIIAVFWISIYGLMTDVREHVVKQRETLTNTAETTLGAFGLSRSIASDIRRIVDRIDAIYTTFNEDELAYIEYRRHVECHPLQRGSEIAIQDGTIIDRPRRLTKRSWTYEDEDAALRRVIRTHGKIRMTGPEEAPIAQLFARRLAPLVGLIDEALGPIFRPGAGI
jgi:hypothetical protein